MCSAVARAIASSSFFVGTTSTFTHAPSGEIAWARQHWPGAERTHVWSAQDHESPHRVPFAGWTPRSRGRVALATGYDRWGMTDAVQAALALSAELLGRRMPWAAGVSTVDGRTCRGSPLCTHLGAALTWNDQERSWDCPAHGSRFGPDGALLEGPATRRLRRGGDAAHPHPRSRRERAKGLLAHPPEPGYPCCISALGELAWVAPREEPPLLYR